MTTVDRRYMKRLMRSQTHLEYAERCAWDVVSKTECVCGRDDPKCPKAKAIANHTRIYEALDAARAPRAEGEDDE